jgi:hypothetical protein
MISSVINIFITYIKFKLSTDIFDKDKQKMGEIVTDTISEARNLLDFDYLPMIKEADFDFYSRFFAPFSNMNL